MCSLRVYVILPMENQLRRSEEWRPFGNVLESLHRSEDKSLAPLSNEEIVNV